MFRRKFILAVIIALSLILNNTPVAGAINFSDVPATAWYYKDVQLLVEKGGINGYPDGTFRPNNNITVAEFVKMSIGTAMGEQKQTSKHWASGFFDKAITDKIILPGDFGDSDYNRPIRREEMAYIISNLGAAIKAKETPKGASAGILTDIKDGTKYTSAIIWCTLNGIITGYQDNTFRGENNASRAEATAMFVRLINESRRVFNELKISDFVSNWDEYKDFFDGIDYYTYIGDVDKYEWRSSQLDPSRPIIITAKDSTLFLTRVAAICDSKIVMSKLTSGTPDGFISDLHPDEIEYFLSYGPGFNISNIFPNPLYKKGEHYIRWP